MGRKPGKKIMSDGNADTGSGGAVDLLDPPDENRSISKLEFDALMGQIKDMSSQLVEMKEEKEARASQEPTPEISEEETISVTGRRFKQADIKEFIGDPEPQKLTFYSFSEGSHVALAPETKQISPDQITKKLEPLWLEWEPYRLYGSELPAEIFEDLLPSHVALKRLRWGVWNMWQDPKIAISPGDAETPGDVERYDLNRGITDPERMIRPRPGLLDTKGNPVYPISRVLAMVRARRETNEYILTGDEFRAIMSAAYDRVWSSISTRRDFKDRMKSLRRRSFKGG